MWIWAAACSRYLEPSGDPAAAPDRWLDGTWTTTRVVDAPALDGVHWTSAIGFAVGEAGPRFAFGHTVRTPYDFGASVAAPGPSGGWTSLFELDDRMVVDLAVAPDGRVCAASWRSLSGPLEVTCDGVVAWSAPEPASTPRIAFDAAGGMHVAWWTRVSSTAVDVRYRGPDGAIVVVGTVPPSLATTTGFDLAVSPDGTPYVAIAQPEPTLWSRDPAGVWSATDLGDDSASDWDQIDVDVSESGSVAVAWGGHTWQECNAPADGDWVNECGDAVSVWHDGAVDHPFVVPYEAAYVNHPELCPAVTFGPGDEVVVAWRQHLIEGSAWAYRIRVATPDAGQWRAESIDDPTTGDDEPLASGCTRSLLARTGPDGEPHLAVMGAGEELWWYERSAPMTEPPPPPPVRTVAELAPGDLELTEWMANPSAAADDVGEWVELFNPTDAGIDLTGLVLVDAASTTGTVAGAAIVPAGGYAIVGRSTAARFVGPIAPAGTWGSTPALNNTGDTLSLRGPVETIATGTVPAAGAAAGRAWQRGPDGRWCASTAAMPGGETGTPGAPNPPCP